MTYAYIESVYPNFVKQQNEPTFPQKITYKPLEIPLGNISPNITTVTQNKGNNLDNSDIFKPMLKYNANNTNNNVIKTGNYNWNDHKNDNLKYYNDPIPEQFTQENNDPVTLNSHTSYVNHVLQCEECRKIVTKQLNLDIDKVKMDEWMELFSYILFGVFILLLLDSFKNK